MKFKIVDFVAPEEGGAFFHDISQFYHVGRNQNILWNVSDILVENILRNISDILISWWNKNLNIVLAKRDASSVDEVHKRLKSLLGDALQGGNANKFALFVELILPWSGHA